jgi:hypothetical protein
MVHALANPPPPPPAKTYHRHLAPQLIEKVKDGDIPEMKRLLDMVRRQRHTTTFHPHLYPLRLPRLLPRRSGSRHRKSCRQRTLAGLPAPAARSKGASSAQPLPRYAVTPATRAEPAYSHPRMSHAALRLQGASPNHKVPTGDADSLRWSAVRWAAMKGTEAKKIEVRSR